MEVKLNTVSARVGCLVLLLPLIHASGAVSLATAGEAIASDAEVNSTIFISDEYDNESPNPSQSAAPESVAGSIVFVEDTPSASFATSPAPQATLRPLPAIAKSRPATHTPHPATTPPVASGDLRVLSAPSNPRRQVASRRSPGRSSTVQMPAPVQARFVAPTTRLPQPTIKQVTAVELAAAPAERDEPGDVQFAVHAEDLGSEIQAPQNSALHNSAPRNAPHITAPRRVAPRSESTALAELLITAHELSLQAKTADEYARISQACAEAIRLGANSDQRQFAQQLASWALNRRGQLRADQGEHELASADFQAALDFNSKNWRAMHNRGVTFAQEGQFAEAFDDFNTVIQLNPRYAKAYANRATLYVQAKDLQSAIKDYERAIEHDREFATAHVGLGRACHMSGRWEEAVEHFTLAVQIDPTSADIVCSRGDLQADRGNYGEALADYARTIELDPEFAHAYRNGAWLLATCPDERYRDPENAILGARQALEYSYGDRHVALDTLAAALASGGQFEAAIQTVTQAVDLAPEDAKSTYLTRRQLYQDHVPFRTEPAGEVSQVDYEAGGDR